MATGWKEDVIVKKVTWRGVWGTTICDPLTKKVHTGRWSQWRNGVKGRWPKNGKFTTDCGKELLSAAHECNHEFTKCEDCEAKALAEAEGN